MKNHLHRYIRQVASPRVKWFPHQIFKVCTHAARELDQQTHNHHSKNTVFRLKQLQNTNQVKLLKNELERVKLKGFSLQDQT